MDHHHTARARTPNGAPPLHRILVVDDDLDILRLKPEALRKSGYQVDAAEDGEAAWVTLQQSVESVTLWMGQEGF